MIAYKRIVFGLMGLSLGLGALGLPAKAAEAQDRRALWQATFKAAKPLGRELLSMEAGSPLAKAGFKVGDRLLAVDEQLIRGGNDWSDITYGLRGAVDVRIRFRRQGSVQESTLQFPPAPLESYSDIDTEYGFVDSDFGIRQRIITTIPKRRSNAKMAAIFVVGGLSCSSIEYTPGRKSNFIRSLRYLVEHSGMIVMRVEKPGVGDSEGRCSQTDFTTELNGYEVALQHLLADKRVDRDRVIVYGSSMGSAIAPYLANQYPLNGVIADGTFYRSWFEHMLEIERRIKAMQGKSESEINQLINRAYIPLYYGMLVEKKTYREVIDSQPTLEPHNYHGDAHMYGRPVAYYHQVQDFDFAGNWQALKVPLRVRWGTNDWIMSEYDNDILAEVLQRSGHKDFVIEKVEGLDHWDAFHPNALSSFQGQPGQWTEAIPGLLVRWAKQLNDG